LHHQHQQQAYDHPPVLCFGVLPVALPCQAEKWRLLLPALALEYITGQPAQYATSTNKYYSKRNLVTGECQCRVPGV
jgi:hypothetical protein